MVVSHIKQCNLDIMEVVNCDAVSGRILELKWHYLLGYELGWLSSRLITKDALRGEACRHTTVYLVRHSQNSTTSLGTPSAGYF